MSWHDRGITKTPTEDNQNRGPVRNGRPSGVVEGPVFDVDSEDRGIHGPVAGMIVRAVAWMRGNYWGGGRGDIGGGHSREAIRKAKRKARQVAR